MEFSDLNLNSSLLNALDDLGISKPTTIQQKSFAPIMSGADIVGIAQTGTGKTFAYLLPALRMWKFTESPHPQILILVPTRELVSQVVEEVEKLTHYMNFSVAGVYGGANINVQVNRVQLGLDLLVGTPGRVMDLLKKGAFKGKTIKKLIIDEVDEMLHQGFRTQLKTIVDFLPVKRQSLMFSATLPDEVVEIIDLFSSHYKRIEAAPSGAALENIAQSAYRLPNFNSKVNMLQHLLNGDEDMKKVLIFT